MQKIVYLFLLICFSLSSKAQCVLDTFYITRISCYQDTGFIDVVYDSSVFSYEWYSYLDTFFTSVISTDEDLESTTCGPFNVVVYDINGMPCDTSPPLFLGCPLGITPSHKNIKCLGDSTGELKRKGYSGTPPYSYQWFKDGVSFSSGPDDTLHSNLLFGQYKVIVTDSIGCTDSITATIFSPPALVFDSLLIDNIDCNGNSTVLEIMVKGGRKQTSGKQYSYYLIQNNDTIAYSDTSGQSSGFSSTSPDTSYLDTVYFSNIFASTDSLIISVVDSFGCTADTTIFIDQPDSIVAFIIPPTNTLVCSYDSASISLDTITGGTSPYTYYWNNDITLTNDSIYVNGGVNRIYIVDANGCLDSTNAVNISSLQDFILFDSITNIDCYGDSSGEIYLQIIGGVYPLSYTWEKDGIPFIGGPSDTIKSNLLVGSYMLVIEDDSLCVDTSIFTLSEPTNIVLTTTYSDPTCSQSNGLITVSVSGGVWPYTYLWQPTGSTSNSVGGLQTGMHTVSVTDTQGCIKVDSIELFSPPPLSVIFTNYNDSLSCYGETTAIIANISGGTTANGNYTILWDNGDTTQQTILSGGTHQISVWDDDSICFISATVFIYTPDSLSISATKIDPSCLGNDGSANINISGGVMPFQYQWSTSTSDTGNTISGLVAGNYWVFVTDACGNDTLEIILDPYISTLNIDNASLTHPSCTDNDGEIDITVSGGFPPYSYSWTPGGQTTNPIIGLGFGNYTVLVTDDCGSEATGTYTLNQMTNTISTSGFYDYLSLWSTVSVNGSNPPFTINWTSIFITGDSIQGLCEGNYPITVTDSKNCEETITVNVMYNINQLVDVNTLEVIDTSWGIEPFSYLWSNGQTTPYTDSLCDGTHTVTITAEGGPFACDTTISFSISPLEVILDPDVTIVDCEDNFNGTIIINPSGGTPNYRFLWSTGDTLDRIEDNLNPGTYHVSLFDKNGCQLDTSIVIAAIGADCIPNVFSPNGVGPNDTWKWNVDQSGDSFLYSESTVTIYGRYGRKMYESVGYDTPWDGKNKKGNPVPDGTYFYVITLKDGAEPIRGTVTIIR